MSRDAENHMITYWMEDKGIEDCFETYYPNLVKTDPILSVAFNQYMAAKFTIEQRAKQIKEEADLAEFLANQDPL
jgi:hypothetical protein